MRATIIAITLLFALAGRTQDLIVTTQGDSIHCAITGVTPDRLYFTVQMEDYRRPDSLPRKQVAMYKRDGYFPVILGSADPQQGQEPRTSEHGWLMSGSFGYSHRTASTHSDLPQELKDYVDGLRPGLHASGSLHYFITPGLALGAQYNGFFGSKNSMPVAVKLQDGTIVQGMMADDVRLRYLGPDLLFRPLPTGATTPFLALSVGRLVYEDRATFINNFTVTGKALAFNVRAGLDCAIGEKLSAGITAGYFACRLNRFEVDAGSQKAGFTLPDRSEESVDRVDLGLILRVRL